MNSTGITGCCSGRNFYNLGGAHGHFTAKDQDDFNKQLYKLIESSINIAITNESQAKTREYLDRAGWHNQKVSERLWCSTISGSNFREAKNKWLISRVPEKKVVKSVGPRVLRVPLATMADLHMIARRVVNANARPNGLSNWRELYHAFPDNRNLNLFLGEIGRHYNIQPTAAYVTSNFWNWYSLLNSVVNRVRARQVANGR